MEISYTDGKAIEARVLDLVSQAAEGDGRSSKERIAGHLYHEWAVRYHLSPERSNLLRPFDFTGLDVLELGAGMGAISRHLAEQAAHLHVVEGTAARYKVLSERLKGLSNWTGQVGNFQDLALDRRFDVVVLIGVLEYAELYLTEVQGSPFLWLLNKAQSLLKPGGVVVVAIENALGLKYWSGAAEDHRSSVFDSICGYPNSPTARTFSKVQLKGLLTEAGFEQQDLYLPYPDYKIPSTVLSEAVVRENPALATELATLQPYDDYLGVERLQLFSDVLASEQLAQAGLLADFSNSFLFVACASAESTTRKRFLRRMLQDSELAWHFSGQRRHPTQTLFRRDADTASIHVRKVELDSNEPERVFLDDHLGTLRWVAEGPEGLQKGQSLRFALLRDAYFNDGKAFLSLFENYLRWGLRHWRQGDALGGAALDATFLNARLLEGETYSSRQIPTQFQSFDLEWVLSGPMAPSWFVFRNVFVLTRDWDLVSKALSYASQRQLYQTLCETLGIKSDLAEDIEREARFQVIACGSDLSANRKQLKRLFRRAGVVFPGFRLPTLRPGILAPAPRVLAVRRAAIDSPG